MQTWAVGMGAGCSCSRKAVLSVRSDVFWWSLALLWYEPGERFGRVSKGANDAIHHSHHGATRSNSCGGPGNAGVCACRTTGRGWTRERILSLSSGRSRSDKRGRTQRRQRRIDDRTDRVWRSVVPAGQQSSGRKVEPGRTQHGRAGDITGSGGWKLGLVANLAGANLLERTSRGGGGAASAAPPPLQRSIESG